MIRFIKIILEEPEKAERIILIIIKLLITLIFSTLLVQLLFPISNFEFQWSDEFNFMSLNEKISPFQLVSLVVYSVIIWIIVWEIIAKQLVIYAVCFPCFLILAILFFTISLASLLIIKCFKKRSISNTKNPNNQITDHLISIGVIPWTGWYYLYLIPLFLTCLIGGTIYILRDIDNLVNSDQADLLSDYLEERIMINQIFEVISQYADKKNYALVKKQNQIELSFSDPNLDEPTRRITICFIILYLNEEFTIKSLTSKDETNFVTIFISNQIPDIPVINYLNNNKIGFIYAGDDVNWIIALEEMEEFALQIQN